MGPSEHLGAKINNPIAAVSGCPQALDSLNYLSVVSCRGQGCLPLSVCLRAETDERVSSTAPPLSNPTTLRLSISSLRRPGSLRGYTACSEMSVLRRVANPHYAATPEVCRVLFPRFYFFPPLLPYLRPYCHNKELQFRQIKAFGFNVSAIQGQRTESGLHLSLKLSGMNRVAWHAGWNVSEILWKNLANPSGKQLTDSRDQGTT